MNQSKFNIIVEGQKTESGHEFNVAAQAIQNQTEKRVGQMNSKVRHVRQPGLTYFDLAMRGQKRADHQNQLELTPNQKLVTEAGEYGQIVNPNHLRPELAPFQLGKKCHTGFVNTPDKDNT